MPQETLVFGCLESSDVNHNIKQQRGIIYGTFWCISDLILIVLGRKFIIRWILIVYKQVAKIVFGYISDADYSLTKLWKPLYEYSSM